MNLLMRIVVILAVTGVSTPVFSSDFTLDSLLRAYRTFSVENNGVSEYRYEKEALRFIELVESSTIKFDRIPVQGRSITVSNGEHWLSVPSHKGHIKVPHGYSYCQTENLIERIGVDVPLALQLDKNLLDYRAPTKALAEVTVSFIEESDRLAMEVGSNDTISGIGRIERVTSTDMTNPHRDKVATYTESQGLNIVITLLTWQVD